MYKRPKLAMCILDSKETFIINIFSSTHKIRQSYWVFITLILACSIVSIIFLEQLNNKQANELKLLSEQNQRLIPIDEQHKAQQSLTAFSQDEFESSLDKMRTLQRLIVLLTLLTIPIITFVFITPLLKKIDQVTADIQDTNNRDYLTGLLNRRSFAVLAEQSIALGKRYKWDLSIIRFDIDHFKSINDDYGNHIGDVVIKDVAHTILNHSRNSDSIFRFNGEEFVLLLPQTNKNDALKLAMKIHNKIANAPIFSDGLIIEVSVSGGIAQLLSDEDSIENTLKRADFGLQEAKNQGRNRIIPAED